MSQKKRIVPQGALNHCYQRAVDGRVLFYTVSDYLLYFTIYCTTAVKYQIRVLKLVLMPDHIHQGVIEERHGDLAKFERNCHSRFAREYNTLFHERGQVFEHSFGSTFKYYEKRIRSTLIYMDNNPVERQLVGKAEEYRWNFLAYGESEHPFSEPVRQRNASRALRNAMKQVVALQSEGRFLPYRLLQRLFRSLADNREREQLTDFIVSTYSIIEHETAIGYFGTYDQELIAAHATTGNEYDLREVFNGKSDAYYRVMNQILKQEGKYADDIHEIFALSNVEKHALLQLLRRRTSAPTRQIAAFLHLPLVVA